MAKVTPKLRELRQKFDLSLSQRVKGITLIELLVVMAIIALIILGMYAGLSYGLKRGRDTARTRAVTAISAAITAYFSDNSLYPTVQDIRQAGGNCQRVGQYYKCDITALLGLNAKGNDLSSNAQDAPLYQYFEGEVTSPIKIEGNKDLDNAMGYYVDQQGFEYAVCTVTELASSGNVEPAPNVNDEGTEWGCFCVGALANVVRCQALEDPSGLPN